MKVLISDPLSEDGISLLREQTGISVDNRPGISPAQLLEALADADALIVRSKTQVTGEVLKTARHLKVIGRAGAGVDNIDLAEATRRGVVVMNTPGGNSISAAEHTLALLLALARRIPMADASMKGGGWEKGKFTGRELQGKTLGILGLGKIGSVLARRAIALEMKVAAYDPYVTQEYAKDLGVELAEFENVISSADFLTLHLPLNEKTHYIIDRETIRKMRRGALVINAARGGLIHEEDLIEALQQGQLGGAALDVFEREPEIHETLKTLDNVILTPHIAGSTREAQAKVGVQIARQISDFLKNGVIINAVNFPSLSEPEMARLTPYINLGEKLGSFLGQINEIRFSEIGLRYYGDLSDLNYKPLTNYILKALLQPMLSEEVNQINARDYLKERGIPVIETISSRERSYANLISIQLRSDSDLEWIEGAVLRKGDLRLVSLDGIPVETHLGETILVIRNSDEPGVIGKVGTILGQAGVNIASFVLGRSNDHAHAVGVVNTDSEISADLLDEIASVSAVKFARVVHLQRDQTTQT